MSAQNIGENITFVSTLVQYHTYINSTETILPVAANAATTNFAFVDRHTTFMSL